MKKILFIKINVIYVIKNVCIELMINIIVKKIIIFISKN